MMSTIGTFQGAEKVQKGTNFRFWVWSFGVLYPGQTTSTFSREIQCRKDSGNENPLLCNGSRDHRNWGENGKFLGQNFLQMDYSTTTISGNITFLVLWHLWDINSPVQLQITGMLTTFCAGYNHIVALRFKGFGFMLTGKLLLIFSFYIKKIFRYILLRRVFLV